MYNENYWLSSGQVIILLMKNMNMNISKPIKKIAYEALRITTISYLVLIIIWFIFFLKRLQFHDKLIGIWAFLFIVIIPFVIAYFIINILFLTNRYKILKKYGSSIFIIWYWTNIFMFPKTFFELNLENLDRPTLDSKKLKISDLWDFKKSRELPREQQIKLFKKDFKSISKIRIFIYSVILLVWIYYIINYQVNIK